MTPRPTNQPLILLVDDAPDVGVILRRYARNASHTVVIEPDAESAWHFLQQARRPDLVVLDLNLPGASGLDLCRRLRATPALADLHIALFSHFQRPQDIVAGIEAGTDFVLSKDLLCEPAGWNARLAEILQPPTGRFPAALLSMIEHTPLELRRLAMQLNQALHSPPAWRLGTGVGQALVRRAWQQACQVPPGGISSDAQNTDGWLSPDGLGIDAERFAQSATLAALPVFVKVLAEQTWRLLGTEASASFWAALSSPADASPQP